jgi:hypothetical protein
MPSEPQQDMARRRLYLLRNKKLADLPHRTTGAVIALTSLLLAGCSATLATDRGRHVVGIAESVSPTTLDVKTSKGEIVQIQLTSQTRYSELGIRTPPHQLKRGDRVDVELVGAESSTAATVKISSPGVNAVRGRHSEQPWIEK